MTLRTEKSRRMALRRAAGLREDPAARPGPGRGPAHLTAHACFGCRSAFKRALTPAAARCPRCGGPAVPMGRSFAVPARKDREAWTLAEALWRAGFRFSSQRSFPLAEPLPRRLRDLPGFLRRNPDHPMRIADPAP